jgi:hypothetical protein
VAAALQVSSAAAQRRGPDKYRSMRVVKPLPMPLLMPMPLMIAWLHLTG